MMNNTDTITDTITHTITERDDVTDEIINTRTIDGAPVLTSELKRMIRKASVMTLRFEQDPDHETWSRDKMLVTMHLVHRRRYPDGTTRDVRIVITGFHGRIGAGYKNKVDPLREGAYGSTYRYARDKDNIHAPTEGVWAFTTAAYNNHLQSCFRMLPTGSELSFQVNLDNGTHGYMVQAGMHGDVLTMTAQPPQGRRARPAPPVEFMLDSVSHPHNTARFGCTSKDFA